MYPVSPIKIKKKIKVELYRLKSGLLGLFIRRRYRNIRDFCLFVGYPRSGHTLIASLLDAHPDIMIGMEWGVLTYVRIGFKKKQLFYSLERSSKLYSKKHKNTWSGYSYHVPNSWQGRYRNLQVIGDKFGGRTSQILREWPDLLSRLENELNIGIKLVHVIRNPYDTITTSTIRFFQKNIKKRTPIANDLFPLITSFFERAATINNLKKEGRFQIHDIYHEKFLEDPKASLESILNFFSLEADDEYYTRCASIVNSEPKKTRFNIDWTADLIDYVAVRMKGFPFLDHYSYYD
jgi:hypothetical protein